MRCSGESTDLEVRIPELHGIECYHYVVLKKSVIFSRLTFFIELKYLVIWSLNSFPL